ncbi:putative disease resistance protein RGA1 [Aristolochia californica]|uniref:putative disease resistance protein RGA1 n=1 Tax=Aristolochia californica TaxID=171875 RepID=UPI0035E050C6
MAVVLQPVLDVVLNNITSAIKEEINVIWGVEEELEKLLGTLSAIRSVLADAEEKQETSQLLNDWLRKLKDVAYDAEDVVDEFMIEAVKKKMEKGSESSRVNQVASFSSCFCLKKVRFRHEIGYRMRDIRMRLDQIGKEGHDFDLVVLERNRTTQNRERPKSSSLVDESVVYGRQNDKNELIKLLLSDDTSGKHPSVVPIVAMGGLGKTTLAQIVYNSKEIQQNFPLRAWVCVSEEFDLKRLTRAIIESLTGQSCDLLEIDPLQQRLKNLLTEETSGQSEQKCLIVLDDMWSENPNDWENLRLPFIYRVRGSKILVTTRSQKVASVMGTMPPYNLRGLPYGDCLTLFMQKGFAGESPDAYPILVEIGMKIVEKCQGVPLALKSLGGLLSNKRDQIEWLNVLQSPIWKLAQGSYDILPILRLSYQNLPSNLKLCFGYCSLFPKDYIFRKDELIELWIEEGYVLADGHREAEDVGNELFDDLLMRSFLYRDSSWKWGARYRMHDLIHDLAEFVTKEDCIRMEEGTTLMVPQRVLNSTSHAIPQMARFSSFVCHNMLTTVDLDGLFTIKSLRTFLFLGLFPYRPHRQVLSKANLDLLLQFKYLRVLKLEHSGLEELPDSIGGLKFLKFVDLSYNKIKKLPPSICSLYNLQRLKLNGCNYLIELPEDTRKLINLRYLDTEKCTLLKHMPPQIGNLRKLQILSRFVSGKEIGQKIAELKDMTNLRLLGISGLESVVTAEEAKEAALKNKNHLNQLHLEWTWIKGTLDGRDGNTDEVVLESLSPHVTLKSLSLYGYAGSRLPSWLRNFTSLQNLTLYECRGLASLGENVLPPSLQSLNISLCPTLHKRCKRNGEDWLKISHVSQVCVNGEYVRFQAS